MIRLLLILLLFASPASAMEMIGFGAAGGACESQSADVSQTSYNTYSTVYPDQERGQSWLTGDLGAGGKELYSLSFRRHDSTGYNSTLTIRIGTSSDLNSYLVEFTCWISTTDTVKECVIPEVDRPTLTGGTTYYALFRANPYLNAFRISRDSTNPYADGVSYYDTTKDWIGTTAGSDLYFITKMCD